MKNKTLTSKVFIILILTMLFLLLLLLGTSYIFYQKSKEEFKEKKENAVNICVQSVKDHLDKAELQLIDLLLNTLDETDLDSTKDMTRYWAKNRLNATIKNKLAVNTDVDCFFVKAKDAFMVKGYNTFLPSISQNHIMNYLWMNEQLEAIKIRSSHWKIIKIDEEAFFYLAYEMGGYMVGAFIRVSIFDDALNLIMDDQVIDSYAYIENDQRVYTYQTELKEQITEENTNKYYNFVNESLIIQGMIPDSDITFVGNFRVKVLELFLNITYIMMTGIVFIFMAMLFVLKRIISCYIIYPIKKLLNGMQHVANGKFDYHIMEDAGSLEFNELNRSFNRMVKEIVDLRIIKYEQQIRDSERRIKLLRMQIKPHFYLNAITTIQSMTYQDRDEDIRTYLDALSEHIRYMLRVNSSEVRLTEELTHIENYLKMQEIKFPNTVAYYIGSNKELQYKEIGHLILFTVIENAFKFAMNLYDTLILLIQCELVVDSDFRGYRVIIEDNGVGFSEEQLEKFRIGNEVEEKQDGKHIGLSNIKKTLELQYGRMDLLRLSNVEPHGARVEIWIPDEKNIVTEGDQYESAYC
jgi:sensor histidine kinase YesM